MRKMGAYLELFSCSSGPRPTSKPGRDPPYSESKSMCFPLSGVGSPTGIGPKVSDLIS